MSLGSVCSSVHILYEPLSGRFQPLKQTKQNKSKQNQKPGAVTDQFHFKNKPKPKQTFR